MLPAGLLVAAYCLAAHKINQECERRTKDLQEHEREMKRRKQQLAKENQRRKLEEIWKRNWARGVPKIISVPRRRLTEAQRAELAMEQMFKRRLINDGTSLRIPVEPTLAQQEYAAQMDMPDKPEDTEKEQEPQEGNVGLEGGQSMSEKEAEQEAEEEEQEVPIEERDREEEEQNDITPQQDDLSQEEEIEQKNEQPNSKRIRKTGSEDITDQKDKPVTLASQYSRSVATKPAELNKAIPSSANALANRQELRAPLTLKQAVPNPNTQGSTSLNLKQVPSPIPAAKANVWPSSTPTTTSGKLDAASNTKLPDSQKPSMFGIQNKKQDSSMPTEPLKPTFGLFSQPTPTAANFAANPASQTSPSAKPSQPLLSTTPSQPLNEQPKPKQSRSLFGTNTKPASGSPGATTKLEGTNPSLTPAPVLPTSGSLFGSNLVPSTSLFSPPAASGTQPPSSLFSTSPPASNSASIFGQPASSSASLFNNSAPASSLFNSQNSAGGLFGSSNLQTPVLTGLFRSTAPSNPTDSLFANRK